ncbi:DUF192 domain-containing protein [Denitromonas iodatirespirans]|uniref:DUF192 domain-containing protein n=1 Tax=Denitromonas iodatirespirans TaxID=2795389 RepID=A0A944D6Y6_DENI1|nr:DUF192 domain-containing protein [Denitromonas iodatirespirans]MBT0959641.1 DUF192 domain-containing protein [Denitromonas iodatirespirans]
MCVRRQVLIGLCMMPLAVQAADSLGRVDLSVGLYRIDAEVAETPGRRAQGLMGRERLLPHEGMVFVFPEPRTHCMWMRNTPLPLSVAFIDEAGRIINIAQMQPLSEDNHCAKRPARYALEVNSGWFAQKGIGPGTKIQGLEALPTPR